MFSKSFPLTLWAALCFLLISPQPSSASIVVNGTRVVYPGNDKEVTVKLSNIGQAPMLVQSWIDTGDSDAKPEKIRVPFILTPPINRIDPNKSQTLRLSYTASPALPENKESVYWLNVLEIPPVKENIAPNRLQVAFRTRIKIFYRPAAIADNTKAADAAEKLVWSFSNGKLQATNSSPYYVSLVSVVVHQGGNTFSTEGEMVPPGGVQHFTLKDARTLPTGTGISYEYVNDWGAVKTVKAVL
ncbi:fimbrial biogenesis chaperone [Serratia fonticola]|uniref:fimbrial biogenesis chaperone n=1 Tax=Serratia fonticola TaxID=47917 RepID=UPI00217CAA8B|nr:fimbria/pilus periplasmic chaperone [Serratia fonticola]CAI1753377.1 Chaperone protein focC precursor [Serratia fonticola]